LKIVIGTRRASLSLVQSRLVANMLQAAGADCELTPIKTIGDTLDVALAESGDKEVFIKEIDEALLTGEIDVAVHDMKDVPTELRKGISIAAVPAREDPRDVFISTRARKLSGLPKGARVGTSSAARRAQLFIIRPDLDIVAMRGNIEGRLKKLHAGKVDAVILSASGLKRLGIGDVITEFLPPDRMIPAVGQGALAVEVKSRDRELVSFVHKACHNKATGIAIRAERSFLKAVGADYKMPVAAHAEIKPSGLVMQAFIATPDEAHHVIEKKTGSLEDAQEIGKKLAEEMLEKL